METTDIFGSGIQSIHQRFTLRNESYAGVLFDSAYMGCCKSRSLRAGALRFSP